MSRQAEELGVQRGPYARRISEEERFIVIVPENMRHPGSDIGQFTSRRGSVNRKSAERDLVPILPFLAADTSDEEDRQSDLGVLYAKHMALPLCSWI